MAATQAQLDEARAKYHQLQIGEAAKVFVDQNGERVEFVQANRANLYLYIQQLEAALAVPGAIPSGVRRPMRFVF